MKSKLKILLRKKNKKMIASVKKISILAVVLFLGAGFAVIAQIGLLLVFGVQADKTLATSSGTQVAQLIQDSYFDNVTLEAKSAYVFDISAGKILFSKNESESLPLASITKLMTVFVAKDILSDRTVITLDKEDLSAEGDSGLRAGERWRFQDLSDVMLLVSSNDAAHAIANYVGKERYQGVLENDENEFTAYFVNMMNSKAQTLGLTTMKFYNESGLDREEKSSEENIVVSSGAYGSAKDVGSLMVYLWTTYPSALEITTRKEANIISQNDIIHYFPNTNEAVGHYSGLIGSKTGYTTLAGGNLAILFDVGIGHPVVAVVLGSTYEGRFKDMQKLTDATLRTFR